MKAFGGATIHDIWRRSITPNYVNTGRAVKIYRDSLIVCRKWFRLIGVEGYRNFNKHRNMEREKKNSWETNKKWTSQTWVSVSYSELRFHSCNFRVLEWIMQWMEVHIKKGEEVVVVVMVLSLLLHRKRKKKTRKNGGFWSDYYWGWMIQRLSQVTALTPSHHLNSSGCSLTWNNFRERER